MTWVIVDNNNQHDHYVPNYRPHSSSLAIKQYATRYATSIEYLHFKNASKIETRINNSNQWIISMFEVCRNQKASLKFMNDWGGDQIRPKVQN